MPDRLTVLRQKITARYQLDRISLRLGEHDFHLRVVRDMDHLLDQLIAKGDDHIDVQDERIPYWADLWHSAIGLADYILKDPSIGPGKQVLELGCGLGLPGMAAGKKGAEVILTDYLSEALELAELLWLENLSTPADCRRLDWREIEPELKPDFVLAADVVYEERNYEPVLSAFRHFVDQGAVVLFSEPGRQFSKPFIERLLAEPFRIEQESQPIGYRELTHQVTVYRLG
jgi:predicted nicotinamide N-methyase